MSLAIVLALAVESGSTQISPAGFTGVDPQVACSGKRVFVACGSGDRIYVLGSADGGRTFRIPVGLPASGRLAVGMRRGPRVAVSGPSVVVSAVYGREGGGQDGDLLSWRSPDEGRTWAGPTRVNDVPGAAREGLHAMAASASGRLACAWLDLRNRGTEVWSSTSDDGGGTWSKNVCVYRSPSGTVCECCHPSLAFGPTGDLYVMFRNWLGGSRDMYLASSLDGGKSFSDAQKLGLGTWPLNACPMDGGAIGVAPDGTVTTAWRRGERVYVAQPGKPEVEVGQGTQPWIASGAEGSVVAWQREGKIVGKGAGPVVALGEGIRPSAAFVGGAGLAVWADAGGTIWVGRP